VGAAAVEALLAAGAAVNAVDRTQRTALHYAAALGHADTTRKLLEVGIHGTLIRTHPPQGGRAHRQFSSRRSFCGGQAFMVRTLVAWSVHRLRRPD
jgi:ankyrin repeat protein